MIWATKRQPRNVLWAVDDGRAGHGLGFCSPRTWLATGKGPRGPRIYPDFAATGPRSASRQPAMGRVTGMGLSVLVDNGASSSLPVSGERPIDLVHLARMTLGDRGLEREVLELFDRQAGMLIVRMQQAARAGICAAAHTLKGSARGIGAWRVARAAEAVELAAGSAAELELEAAIVRLGAAAAETRAVIADLLQPN